MNQQNLLFEYKSQRGNTYICEELIGSGAQGLIYRGYNKDLPNQKVAIKITDTTNDDELQFLYKLLNTSNQINNIIKYYEVDNNLNTSFKKYCFVMELGTRNLLEEIQQMNKIEESHKIEIIQQIAMGIKEVHHLKHIHRDIKPENILKVGDKWKLCDFGFLKHQISQFRTSKVGTPYYISPEIAFQDPKNPVQYNNKVDIWSFGCIIYEILTGILFFQGDSPDEVVQQIHNYCFKQVNNPKEKNNDNRFNMIKNLKLQKLCKCMMTVDPSQRYDIKQVMEELMNPVIDKIIIPNNKISTINKPNLNTQTQIPIFQQQQIPGQSNSILSNISKPQNVQPPTSIQSIQSLNTKDQKVQLSNPPQFQFTNTLQGQPQISQSNSKLQPITFQSQQPQQFLQNQPIQKNQTFQPQFPITTPPQITSNINQPNIDLTQKFTVNNTLQNQNQGQVLMQQLLERVVNPKETNNILNYFLNQKKLINYNDTKDKNDLILLQIIVDFVNDIVNSTLQNKSLDIK